MWSVPPSVTVPPWAVSLWAEGQLLPLTQVPPLAWAAFPSSHPPVLTNPKCSRLAGPCRPHSLPQHSLPQHSLQPIPSAVGIPVRGARRCLSPAFQQLGFLAPFATTHIVLSALAFNTVATQPAICTPTAAEEQRTHPSGMGICRKL